MKTYLSIDLDYWHRSTKHACTRFFQKVWQLKLPIYVAMYHHHLLPHINANEADQLLNIDHHSDLVNLDGSVLDFNEGTWGNFVDWRLSGLFHWRYPQTGGQDCHVGDDPFTKSSFRVCRWGQTKKQAGVRNIPWKSIVAVGVCLSPDYIGKRIIIAEPITKLRIEKWANGGSVFDRKVYQPKVVRVK